MLLRDFCCLVVVRGFCCLCGVERLLYPCGVERLLLSCGGEKLLSPCGGERLLSPCGGERLLSPCGGERLLLSVPTGVGVIAIQGRVYLERSDLGLSLWLRGDEAEPAIIACTNTWHHSAYPCE